MEAVIEPVKVAGFIKRSANKEKIEQEEAELKKLTEVQNEEAKEEEVDDGPEPTDAEERSFKKRYGDLRRHSQKKELDLQKQIDDLKAQLEKSTKQQIKLPKSEVELEEWSKEYPDVAKIVETIAIKKASEKAMELELRMKQIDEMAAEAKREKAEAQLLQIHPDFIQIREQSEFHDWVEQQPKWVQQALYDNEDDHISAARAIDLYKADKGISTKKQSRKEADKDAARSVTSSRRGVVDSDSESGTFRESDVERMSPGEYEKNQDAIVAAIRSGKFIYDLTGSAR